MLRQLALSLGLLLVTGDALAYCQSTTCDPKKDKQQCKIDENGCRTKGNPLYWYSACVGFSLNIKGSNNIPYARIEKAFEASLEAWSNLPCGNEFATLSYGRREDVYCSLEQTKEGPNANTVIFRDDLWPYEGSENVLGYTTVTFIPSTGVILGADIEINTAQNVITTSDLSPKFDLQSILTHELGHAVGLSHSNDNEATMRTSYGGESIDLRDLAQDDIDAICSVYPPSRKADCDLSPYGGFSNCRSDLAPPEETTTTSCALDPRSPSLPWPRGAFLFPLAALALRCARRRR